MKILKLLKALTQVGPALNDTMSGKKTNLFNLLFALLTVFKPEWIETMVNGANTVATQSDAFIMDPKTQALIVLLNMLNVMLRNWSVLWGGGKKAIQATPVQPNL